MLQVGRGVVGERPQPVLNDLEQYLLVLRVGQLVECLVTHHELVDQRGLLGQNRLRLLQRLQQLLQQLSGLRIGLRHSLCRFAFFDHIFEFLFLHNLTTSHIIISIRR